MSGAPYCLNAHQMHDKWINSPIQSSRLYNVTYKMHYSDKTSRSSERSIDKYQASTRRSPKGDNIKPTISDNSDCPDVDIFLMRDYSFTHRDINLSAICERRELRALKLKPGFKGVELW